METIGDILKYILPSLVVLATTWYLIRAYLLQEQKRNDVQVRQEMQKASFPLRMQAYERLVLLLERLQPAGLILRINLPGMNVSAMHAALIQAIREEFDHNLSQQLYVSSRAWELVKNCREESIRLINTAASQLSPEDPATELASRILVQEIGQNNSTADQAIEFLKKEARENFF